MSEKQKKLKLDAVQSARINVDEYEFEPIKGYPMLKWRGKRPFKGTQYYPAQLKEVYGDEVGGWRNQIYWGDNLQVLSHLLKEYRGKIDLVYIDPPFDSKADYKKEIRLKGRKVSGDSSSFEEKQYTDIWANDEYLQFMYERLIIIRELIGQKGSIFLHADWHKSHQLRCILDEVFGASNFINEIVWCYFGPGSPGMRQFNRKHDNIFWYSKDTGSWVFNSDAIRVPHDEKTAGNFKSGLRGSGFIEGDYKITDGKIPEDHWNMAIAGRYPNDGRKRVGYPTEKPLPLLERIIEAASPPGGLVLDCFMGSGVTAAASIKLGRKFIGADINLESIQSTTKRAINIAEDILKETAQLEYKVRKRYTGLEVKSVNYYDVFRNPIEARELLIEALEIQKLDANNVYDGEKSGRMVKVMPVTRIATKADLNELIAGFDYKAFDRRQTERPNKPVERILLVCMGHEADLAASLQSEVNYKLDIEVVDILRDKSNLEFKRDSEARIQISGGELVVEEFYPMNLLQKLSLQKENVEDWRELVESVMVDWNFDGAVLSPTEVDIPNKNQLVNGKYTIPKDAGTIRVKITDLLSESLEMDVPNA